ncbi:uncharacterized protein F5891DRAFT_1015587 [Suillus fuscotomentosus]|uniref:Secreted protein n=1 Tax=Suillus fuscotomentosus TaxID=1912939 RepID=A0AAD4ED98_9AGAM|nr:uncharacterized protein F5891DRAFT_1015587 [Suillus fuscotomentosus]KAG1903872.1 hypothetical protein F5891DRAFT_1015587 [Suillus fuscotomentosus]
MSALFFWDWRVLLTVLHPAFSARSTKPGCGYDLLPSTSSSPSRKTIPEFCWVSSRCLRLFQKIEKTTGGFIHMRSSPPLNHHLSCTDRIYVGLSDFITRGMFTTYLAH